MTDQSRRPTAGGHAMRARQASAPSFPDSDRLGGAGQRLGLFTADSLVVATARELLSTHVRGRSDDNCSRCDLPDPCPTVQNAILVCEAAGVPTSGQPAGMDRASLNPGLDRASLDRGALDRASLMPSDSYRLAETAHQSWR